MKRRIVSTILVVIALTLIAQPTLASHQSLAEPMPTQALQRLISDDGGGGIYSRDGGSYDGENKFENTWWGFRLYLSRGTLLWIGAGVSGAGLTSMLVNLAFAPLGAVVSAVAFILIGLGTAFFITHSIHDYGVKLTFITCLTPAPLLIGVSPQPAP